jgi:acetyl esterase/lipase
MAAPVRGGGLGSGDGLVAVVGDSSGGGIAASLTLLQRDSGGPRPVFQYLSIPMLDSRLDTGSMRTFVDAPVWNRASAVKAWEW